MVGVTFEFSRTTQDKPDQGRIEATVDGSVSSSSSLLFLRLQQLLTVHLLPKGFLFVANTRQSSIDPSIDVAEHLLMKTMVEHFLHFGDRRPLRREQLRELSDSSRETDQEFVRGFVQERSLVDHHQFDQFVDTHRRMRLRPILVPFHIHLQWQEMRFSRRIGSRWVFIRPVVFLLQSLGDIDDFVIFQVFRLLLVQREEQLKIRMAMRDTRQMIVPIVTLNNHSEMKIGILDDRQGVRPIIPTVFVEHEIRFRLDQEQLHEFRYLIFDVVLLVRHHRRRSDVRFQRHGNLLSNEIRTLLFTRMIVDCQRTGWTSKGFLE